jgi:tRNA acetyltransferase TAN1
VVRFIVADHQSCLRLTLTIEVLFISLKPPIDPVKLISTYFEKVERTGLSRTRYVFSQCGINIRSAERHVHRHARRFTPITATCTANTPDIIALSKKIIPPAFITDPPRSFRVLFPPSYLSTLKLTKRLKFKIELSHRCHNKLKPDLLKPEIAKAVPLDAGHSVDLKNPELVILVELYMVTP